MFKGIYNFFDYKYNIVGYNGQDFGSVLQYLYLIISIILIVILLILLRKSSNKKVLTIIRFIGIFMCVFYLSKTTWESIYDIKRNGVFNYYLLPLDTCSIIMLASLISGFSNNKLKDYASSWLIYGGVIGGISNMLFLNALKYYPFFTFGAFYSMIWHFLMVFLGLLLVVTNYVSVNYKSVLKGFIFHLIICLIVIPINYIFNFDFMLLKDLGGVPIFEGVATNLTNNNLGYFNPLLMISLYFISFNILFIIYYVCKKIRIKK